MTAREVTLEVSWLTLRRVASVPGSLEPPSHPGLTPRSGLGLISPPSFPQPAKAGKWER